MHEKHVLTVTSFQSLYKMDNKRKHTDTNDHARTKSKRSYIGTTGKSQRQYFFSQLCIFPDHIKT